MHGFSELWIVDHSTTTQQAAGHSGGNNNKGGDLLYRWGNPRTYGRGTINNRIFYAQHHATWIPQGYPNAGNIMVFNNGQNRPGGNYSSVDMVVPPLQQDHTYLINGSTAYGPDTLFWTYTDPLPTNLYASNISGAYALPNGSFLISDGPAGTVFEVDSNKNTVWKYVNPVVNGNAIAQGAIATNNLLFRANYYPLDYFNFSPDLNPGDEVELNPTSPSICEQLAVNVEEVMFDNIVIYPNPAEDVLYINSAKAISSVQLYNGVGQLCYTSSNSNAINAAGLPSGLYVLKVSVGSAMGNYKVFIK
ncbi:MAG: T9SS type A sorting domain-containing protein [Sphingobacteriales bacterium JAD_PAG50586_3]|nr:MAG: T9SS type A sorting domain-containing protein [Sphingobacteriales bacterium JAD_PAG50586_3]